MASSTRYLCRNLIQISRNVPSIRRPFRQIRHPSNRPFSCAPSRSADDPASTGKAPTHWSSNKSKLEQSNAAKATDEDAAVLDESQFLTPEVPYTVDDLSTEERADYEVLSKADQAGYLRLQNHVKALVESGGTQEELQQLVDQADKEIERQGAATDISFPTARAKGHEVGYWAEDEEDEFGQMEDADDDWGAEDITTVAHSELDLHRDIREYTRIAAWDLPLLQQYAKPFQPPNQSTPLRFRYTTYMGETHPAARKVVVEFCVKDLMSNPSATYKISEAQRAKLIKLAGVRYNPDSDMIKMSSEKFETAAQNKRYLGELVGQLIKEAKDKRDDLKDIPFDFRHHKPKTVTKFPEEWKLSNQQKVKQLAARREQQKLLPPDASAVDGSELVREYVRVGRTTQARLTR